jgi:hypothetical protein
MKSKQACTRDTRFIPEVQLTVKVAYIFIEVSTKDWVSLGPNLTARSPSSILVFHYQIPMKERAIQTF